MLDKPDKKFFTFRSSSVWVLAAILIGKTKINIGFGQDSSFKESTLSITDGGLGATLEEINLFLEVKSLSHPLNVFDKCTFSYSAVLR